MPKSTKRMSLRSRLQLYRILTLPHRDYEPRTSFFRFDIPLILKMSNRAVSTEADALRFLNRALPNLPIPKLVDSFTLDGVTYTVMTKLPGERLLDLPQLSPEALSLVALDIVVILQALWRIPQPKSIAGKVMMSASGHGLPHPRTLHEHLGGPYDSTLQCYKSIVAGDLTSCPSSLTDLLARDPIVWVHTDLRMQNILIQNGRVSGVVDWEDSGWFPTHWQLHILRRPCNTCLGAWLRYWKLEHRFNIVTEAAYDASLAKDIALIYPL